MVDIGTVAMFNFSTFKEAGPAKNTNKVIDINPILSHCQIHDNPAKSTHPAGALRQPLYER